MASRQQIERLSQRIDALVVSKVLTCAVIRVGARENEEAAIEQHYRNHPFSSWQPRTANRWKRRGEATRSVLST